MISMKLILSFFFSAKTFTQKKNLKFESKFRNRGMN